MRIVGQRALLFTDIEGSTALLQRVGALFFELLDQHHRLLRAAFAAHGGTEIGTAGDSFVVLFDAVADAAAAAIDAQERLAEAAWPDGAPIVVRMGVHCGEIGESESGYVGLALHEAARVCAAGHGGQVLLSAAAVDALDPDAPSAPVVRLLGTFDVRDLGPQVPLYQLVHPGLREDFPAPRARGSVVNNLPAQLTSFVGRQDELVRVARLVREHRLVTLFGAGGVGKTRLALAAAATVAVDFPDGVFLVELAPLQGETGVLDELCSSLRLDVDTSREREVLQALRDRRLLLVLDNCEHVVGDVARLLGRLLRASPGVHVLATSREPLEAEGEARWRVPSMTQEEAEALFLARSRLAAPERDLDAGDRSAMARLCAHLDGIPLAIELVAARVDTAPLAELEERLRDHFELLSFGARGREPRHATLRGTLEWSYQLLTPDEQRLLRALSVFAGRPTAEAVAAVCDEDPGEVRRRLDALHLKSLVSVDPGTDPVRTRVAEIVRQYAAEKLHDAGGAGHLAERHAHHYANVVTRIPRGGRDRQVALQSFASDTDDLAAAFDWLERRDATTAARMLLALRDWFLTAENESWRERLVRLAQRDDVPTEATAVANAVRAFFGTAFGRESAQTTSISVARSAAGLDAIADPFERLSTLAILALGAREADPALADRLVVEAEDLATELGDPAAWASALADLIFVHDENHRTTQRLRAVALELATSLDERVLDVGAFVDAALAAHVGGRYDEAFDLLDRAEALLDRVFPTRDLVTADALTLAVWSVFIRAETGDTTLALLVADDLLARLGDDRPADVKLLAASWGQALLLAGRPEPARHAFLLAADRPDGWRYLTVALAQLGLAMLDLDEGHPEQARTRLEPMAHANSRPWVRARADDLLAEAALALGAPDQAAWHADRADACRTEHDVAVPPAFAARWAGLRARLSAAAAS